MTFFFLVVGLEAKREFDTGEFRERQRVAIPVAAALGGMAVPIAIFLTFNAGGDGAHGWGAAMSTDTALALGVAGAARPERDAAAAAAAHACGGRRPGGAGRDRHRLFRVDRVDAPAARGRLLRGLVALRYVASPGAGRRGPARDRTLDRSVRGRDRSGGRGTRDRARHDRVPACPGGPRTGHRAGAVVPGATNPGAGQVSRAAERRVGDLRQRAAAVRASSLDQLRDRPGVRAGQRRRPHRLGLLGDAVTSPITLGIFFGYVFGKPLGVLGATWLASRPWLAGLQRALSWPVIAGGGAVAGVGFTVSVLISSLAFEGQQLEEAKLGVLAAATASTLVAWGVFSVIRRLPTEVSARQIAGTDEDLLDLSEDVDPERDHIRGSPGGTGDAASSTATTNALTAARPELVVRELLDSFGDDLRYVWRHLPLNDVHPNAQMAAEASEAAGAQGGFWEMNDRLLPIRTHWTRPDLTRYAEELGLDVDRFWDELRRREYADRVADDVSSADASGVAGTPGFFINGRRHSGAYDIDTLSRAVETARRTTLLRNRARGQREAEPAQSA